ncbi:CHAD domain-containing protein [Rhodocista pekingensis]|uniref:CHAD domain-containing protein n=1 Tax=Rhodocista pekingensis TaxID=201185 RepID=A0ABW2L023_9PROT
MTGQPTPSQPRPQPIPSAGSPAPTREIELKLCAPAADLLRLLDLDEVTSIATGPAQRTRQRTTYFDTPDLRLARGGIALRVRRVGNSRVQAVKTTGSAPGPASGKAGGGGAVAVRREWEWPIQTDTPDLSLLSELELDAALPDGALDRLGPVFVTDVQRTTVLLRPDPRVEVELAIDIGQVTASPPGAAQRHQPISEVELELKAGRMSDLLTLAAALHRRVPLHLSTRSKADEGFGLLTGRRPRSKPAGPVGLSPATTVAEAFRHIGRNALGQLLDNAPAFQADGDPEALREMAAATRRLEAAFVLFKDVIVHPRRDGLRHELRGLAEPLALARAWDRVAARVSGHGGGAAAGPLAAAVATARRTARLQALETLNGPAWTGWALGFGAWLEDGAWADGEGFAGTMREIAPTLLAKRLAKLEKSARKLPDGPTAKLWRRLQRLRYGIDFFRSLFPADRVRPVLAAVDSLRGPCKTLMDGHEAETLLADMRDGLPRESRAALRSLLETIATHRAEARAALPAAWADLRATPVFWD